MATFLTHTLPDIQSCWVDPLPERDTMVKFEGKNVAEQIARYEDRDTQ